MARLERNEQHIEEGRKDLLSMAPFVVLDFDGSQFLVMTADKRHTYVANCPDQKHAEYIADLLSRAARGGS